MMGIASMVGVMVEPASGGGGGEGGKNHALWL